MSGASANYTEFSGANLGDANLSGAWLNLGTLVGGDLSQANLSGSTLFGADLTGANLAGAKLHGVLLIGANLNGADLRGADLTGAVLILPVPPQSATDFSYDNLTGPELRRALAQTDFARLIYDPVIRELPESRIKPLLKDTQLQGVLYNELYDLADRFRDPQLRNFPGVRRLWRGIRLKKRTLARRCARFLIIGIVVFVFFGISAISRAVRCPPACAGDNLTGRQFRNQSLNATDFSDATLERGGFQRGMI